MNVGLFLENKIKRQLDINGVSYSFKKTSEDEYHQVKESEEEVIIKALYHNSKDTYVTGKDNNASRMVTRYSPMLLMLKADADKISKDDTVIIGETKMRVVKKRDVNQLGVCFDVSLEEVI